MAAVVQQLLVASGGGAGGGGAGTLRQVALASPSLGLVFVNSGSTRQAQLPAVAVNEGP